MKTDDNGKKLDGHIFLSNNEFDRKKMDDYHNHYLKKDVFLLADV